MALLCETLEHILEETHGCGVPLGASVESVSLFRKEIEAVHELMRRTQAITLDMLGFKWKVNWYDVAKKEEPAAAPPPVIALSAANSIVLTAAVASVVAAATAFVLARLL